MYNEEIFSLLSSKNYKSIVPRTKLDIFFRKFSVVGEIFKSKQYRSSFKRYVNYSYAQFLAPRNGVEIIKLEDLLDWNDLEIRLSSPTSKPGQTSHLELLCIVAISIENLKSGDNFLEIGTYDGNTALNVGINLPSESKVITIDLPEEDGYGAKFEYDNWLVNNPARKQKKHLKLENVEQIYCDSTELDFSNFSFNGAFIDGGHDFETVKSDTINVLTYIKRPGFILWHD